VKTGRSDQIEGCLEGATGKTEIKRHRDIWTVEVNDIRAGIRTN
jgi:hypothetical protein